MYTMYCPSHLPFRTSLQMYTHRQMSRSLISLEKNGLDSLRSQLHERGEMEFCKVIDDVMAREADMLRQLEGWKNKCDQLKNELELKDRELAGLQENVSCLERLHADMKMRPECYGVTPSCLENVNSNEGVIAALQQAIYNLKANILSLNDQDQVLRARLSKVLSDRQTFSDIEDVTDKNRPSAVVQDLRTLYDNEWTDAFSLITDMGVAEETACKFLLDVVMTAYEFSKNKVTTLKKNVPRLISHPLTEHTTTPPPALSLTVSHQRLSGSADVLDYDSDRCKDSDENSVVEKEDTFFKKGMTRRRSFSTPTAPHPQGIHSREYAVLCDKTNKIISSFLIKSADTTDVAPIIKQMKMKLVSKSEYHWVDDMLGEARMTAYIERSASVAWRLAVHHQQLILDQNDCTYDHHRHEVYSGSSRSRVIKFHVWPTLLWQDRTVACKGVVALKTLNRLPSRTRSAENKSDNFFSPTSAAARGCGLDLESNFKGLIYL
ncbi:uncharacterized protein LOC106175257 [Lingula anatina]|uniref:Mitochondria-eating protein n=1 Tax=Lingula anatina TaxID=7574 RepID=A0A1S3JQJ0_LINAN|nr:uncharacterized protein LOC106175257 [Lingula anatina]|eukprot:XP_013412620.1 uncharacterized protein LOC106175257 [Lingula anatina]